MKVGDLVKWRGTTVMITKMHSRAVPNGTDDGDLRHDRSWDLLVDGETIRVKRRLPVVSSS
tara:strand:+ start:786 stop:968 length:183 start_codon:yes stop_codon:yes gene_type:complete